MENNELRHHGILGQKWGVRRFQNKDGTRTEAGKKRYGIVDTVKEKIRERVDERDKENRHRIRMEIDPVYRHKQKEQPWNEKPSNRKPWDEKPSDRHKYSTEKKAISSKKVEKSAKDMSDEELRNRLNRLQMEQQYSKLTSEKTSKGKKYLDKIIKAGTTVATITTTALTIYKNLDKIGEIVDKAAGKIAEADKLKWVL